MNAFKHLVGVAALVLIFCAGASADTLELKDGRVIQGRYLGGTRVIVRFEVEGDVQTFRVSEVSAVRLDRRSGRDRDDNPPPNGPYEGAPPPDQGQPNDQGGNGAFALDANGRLNWQAIRDNAHVGIHEMTVTGKALTQAMYGIAPKYSYFNGCSTGGRQGLMEAQRYPEDYNGIVSASPATISTSSMPNAPSS